MKKLLPSNMHIPLGKYFIIHVFVGADHARDSVTRRPRTGFIVILNNAPPIYWLSQTSCGTRSFGSGFCAMKHAYKLCMFRIPIHKPAFILGDNQSVLCNTLLPGSMIKKKSNCIAYHFAREGCAKDEWHIAYCNTHTNVVDLMVKPLAGEKQRGFVWLLLRHMYDQK